MSTTPINSMYTVKLMNDVDMGNGTINSIKFSGTFDGGNHTISNLIVDGVDTYSNGLFSGFGGVKKNFTLNNIKIKRYGTDDTSYAGAVTGVIQDGCSMEIENVHVINSKIGGVQSIGGLIGYVAVNTTFTATNCTVDGSVLSNDDIAGESGCMGGLVGRGGGKMTITNCKVSNSVINAYINDANQHKRTSSKFFGNFVGGNGVLTIAGCSVETVTLNAMGSNPEEQ